MSGEYDVTDIIQSDVSHKKCVSPPSSRKHGIYSPQVGSAATHSAGRKKGGFSQGSQRARDDVTPQDFGDRKFLN